MDEAELRSRLKSILEAEERGDWVQAEALNDELNRDVLDDNFEGVPHIVHHFLDDGDIREKDAEYGEAQRQEIHRFVETGECEDSKPVSVWTCVAIAALIVTVLVWLLT
jgi:hypothetical protein